MKAYYRISMLSADQIAETLAQWIDVNSRYFTLTWLDFWDGIINMRDNDEYENHKDEIEEYVSTDNEAVVYSLNVNNIMEHCDDDNIVEFDLDTNSVHIWYAEEFGL